MMQRTLDDIRSNLDHVGCDNATALELCNEIDNLCAQLREAGEREGLLQQQLETANRNHDDLRANFARVVETNEKLSAELRQCQTELVEAANLLDPNLPGCATLFSAAIARINGVLEQKVRGGKCDGG
jgi:hypothetical protein